ncbi:MAG: hypothetical protein L6R48_25590, partial [Planctomycetes bacterium]|nr:hypothetical protein [Planctomycetota bacterium]
MPLRPLLLALVLGLAAAEGEAGERWGGFALVTRTSDQVVVSTAIGPVAVDLRLAGGDEARAAAVLARLVATGRDAGLVPADAGAGGFACRSGVLGPRLLSEAALVLEEGVLRPDPGPAPAPAAGSALVAAEDALAAALPATALP